MKKAPIQLVSILVMIFVLVSSLIFTLLLVFCHLFDGCCVVLYNDRKRTGLCDVGEFEKRPPVTEAKLKKN